MKHRQTHHSASHSPNRWQRLPLLLAFVALLFSSCATTPPREATRSEIESLSQRAIAKRETWGGTPYCTAVQDPFDGTWRVEAHAIDSAHPDCGCVLFVPGTRREILFSRSGRLISYVSPR